MKKAKLKTAPTKLSVKKYIDSIEDKSRKRDCLVVLDIMKSITKEEPVMWGTSIVGFGKREMTYASGRKVDWLIMGFSSRKDSISFYLTCDIAQMKDKLKNLGKYKTGVGCLYIKKLEDIDLVILKDIIKFSTKIT